MNGFDDNRERAQWLFIIGIIVWIICLCAMIAVAHFSKAQAQLLNHHLHHAQYQNWRSLAGVNCCNDNDCGELPDKDVRESGADIEVKVEDQWCPVLAGHRLSSGKSPDWSKNHACIIPNYSGLSACERFKCFTGKAQL